MRSHKYISNLSLQVSQNSANLTSMEKDMVQKLLQQRSLFTYKTFTIAYISKTLNVSSTSLHRLSRKLGYSSFAFLKEDYFAKAQEVETQEDQDDFELRLSNTCHLVKQALSEEMIDTIVNAKRITLYGMGVSSLVAKIYQTKMSLMGVPTQQYDDSRFMRISSHQLNAEDDVVIVLSRSGCPPELIEVLSIVNENQVPSIIITEMKDSPLESLASYVIYTMYSQDNDNAIDTRIHTHIAMDILMERVIKKIRKRSEE